jgi:hypothetical protein
MLLANPQRRPTYPRRLTTARPPRLWGELPVDERQHLACIVARLVRRIRSSLEQTSANAALANPYIRKGEVEAQ